MIFRDPSLPHQIKLVFIGHAIAVGCNCKCSYLGIRMRWDDPGEPARLWRAHMAEVA